MYFTTLFTLALSSPIALPYEIKRHLLLGRKVMTNLDSILKSRDITLPTKVCLVKAMVFPVVMYGCESWTVKKAERRRIDAFDQTLSTTPLCPHSGLLRIQGKGVYSPFHFQL